MVNLCNCCYVCGQAKDGTISFFRLPSDLKYRKEWYKRLNITPKLMSIICPFICSSHFTADQFISDKKDRLKRNAIPLQYKGKVHSELLQVGKNGLKNRQRHYLLARVMSLEDELIKTQQKLNLVCNYIKKKFSNDQSLPNFKVKLQKRQSGLNNISTHASKIVENYLPNQDAENDENDLISNQLKCDENDLYVLPSKNNEINLSAQISQEDGEDFISSKDNIDEDTNSVVDQVLVDPINILFQDDEINVSRNLLVDFKPLLNESQEVDLAKDENILQHKMHVADTLVRAHVPNILRRSTHSIKKYQSLSSSLTSTLKSNLLVPRLARPRKVDPKIDESVNSLAFVDETITPDDEYQPEVKSEINFETDSLADYCNSTQNSSFIGTCSLCELMFGSPQLLYLHQMSHCFVKLQKIPINTSSKTKFSLISHKIQPDRSKSKGNPSIDLSSVKKQNSFKIVKKNASKVNNFEEGTELCLYCNKKFRSSLRRHKVRVHMDELTEEDRINLVVKPREKKLKKLKNRNFPLNKVKRSGKFQCSYCSKNMSLESLRDHKIRYHLKELTEQDKSRLFSRSKEKVNFVTCSYCQDNFINHQHLHAHLKKNHRKELTEEEREKLKKKTKKAEEPAINFYEDEINGNTIKIYFKVTLPCNLCSRLSPDLNNSDKLIAHMKKKHNLSEEEIYALEGPRDYKCRFENCANAQFNERSNFIIHMLTTHYKDLSPKEKEENLNNTQKLSNIGKYALENNESKKVSNFICIEPECTSEFVGISLYYTHLVKTHKYSVSDARKVSGVKNITCNYCPNQYISKHTYIRHLATFHLNEISEKERRDVSFILKSKKRKFYNCVECKLNFRANLNYYKNHMKLMHSDKYAQEFGNEEQISDKKSDGDEDSKKKSENPLVKCEICGSLLLKMSLYSHMVRSHREKDKHLKCPELGCTYSTYTYDRLRSHADTHSTVKLFKCSLCPHSTKRSYCLVKHMKIKHSDTPRPSFFCDQCGASMTSKNSLNKHKLFVHENYRPFPCPRCEMKFKTKTSLNYHVKSHDNPQRKNRGLNKERPFLFKKKPGGQKERNQPETSCNINETTESDLLSIIIL